MDKKYTNSRRRALKSMMAGGAAATGAGLLQKEWAKPVVDSVVLPAHAQTTEPLIGGFLTSASMAYSATSFFDAGNVSGSLTPANSPESVNLLDPLNFYSYQLTPSISVAPGTVGNFNLTMNESAFAGGDDTNFTPATENVGAMPDGSVVFSTIAAGVDNATSVTWEVTLTPDDPAIGAPFIMAISFD
ncbi:MAG: hypothetical protein OEQ39_17730 [Gammaproteobacteria bacterium]|nr:hypothetical protein [Gammaproteobacteria bacterium]MDH3468126.1 hypothetical protein [Gammaproteobacteria bacterium]